MFEVSILKLTDYNNCRVAIEKSLELLGGCGKYIKTGDKILIKPNLLCAKSPESAATTHPEIIKQLALIIKDCGGVPLLGDSPGRGTAVKVFNRLGLTEFIKNNKIEIVDCFTPIIKRKTFQGRELKFTVFKGIEAADKIWSVAKLKTHGQMLYTGAIKNLFGLIPGGLKPELHFRYPDNLKFAEMIVDIYELINPDFAVIDAVTAMEGNGPGAGTPKNLNCLILSANALAADMCALKIIGYKPGDVPIINAALNRKLGPGNYDDIRIVGATIDCFIDKQFRKIGGASKITKFLPGIIPDSVLKTFILSRPIVNDNICVKCRKCEDICYGKYVKLERGKIRYDYENCIRCYCCQEICPVGAIIIYKPPLLKCFNYIIEKL